MTLEYYFLHFFNPGSNIDDVIRSLRSQNILTEMFNASNYALNGSSYVTVAPHSGALSVSLGDKVRTVSGFI